MKKISPFLFLMSFLSLITFTRPLSAENAFPQKCPVFENVDSSLDALGKPISMDNNKIRVKVDGEFRYRLEYRDDFSFNDRTFEDNALNLFRSRLGLNIESDYLTVYAQGQDAESISDSGISRSSLFVNQLDLHQLYAEVKDPNHKFPFIVKVGRQELSYGDQRFVGAFGWSNVGRVFDAVKTVFTPISWFKADLWFSQVVAVNRSQADTARHHENFYGLYTVLGPWKDQSLDSFLFIKHDRDNGLVGELPGQRGQLKQYTAGNRFKGKLSNLDYGIEWANQFGTRAHNDIRAWAWHSEIGYTFVPLPADPRLSFEYNHGSGDRDPTDGTVKNFDNLYPTNHPFYGYMDLASLRNLHHLGLMVRLKPLTKLKFEYGHHWFFLSTPGSAWFNAGQGVIRAASSGADTTIGQESDLLMTWAVLKHVDFQIGYSHFHAGAFVTDTGASDDANFFYVQTGIRL